VAAGFDKNAEVPDAMLALGFGFTEIGTVTPKPQAGNPRPRLFRLPEDNAVINRMGFNNEGHAAALRRLYARRGRGGIVGVNIGANKDSADRIGDYVQGIAAFAHVASYFTVNISSPNTPGLRGLQSRAELEQLLGRINDERARQERQPPMLLKIAPDLREDELEDIAAACSGGAVDGIIVSNTTLSRDGLHSGHAKEQGGLSGLPLLNWRACSF
jgi:dihydroorotate dehydrogenase